MSSEKDYGLKVSGKTQSAQAFQSSSREREGALSGAHICGDCEMNGWVTYRLHQERNKESRDGIHHEMKAMRQRISQVLVHALGYENLQPDNHVRNRTFQTPYYITG